MVYYRITVISILFVRKVIEKIQTNPALRNLLTSRYKLQENARLRFVDIKSALQLIKV